VKSNTATSTSTARVNLHQPSASYTGTTILFVYVDKIYKTLMYSFLPPLTSNAYCQ
jgi:hypothetical protein